VHLTSLGSHRGIVQPVAAIAAVCREVGIPLIVDAAQAFAHLDCVDVGADAVYSSSRKWTAGPRGLGVLAARGGLMSDQALARLAHAEANVAAQVGLSIALGEHLAAGPARIQARLAEVGTMTRTALAGVAGWQVVEPTDEPSAITTLTPPDGVDPAVVRAKLIAEHRIVATYAGTERAPREMTRPALRLSPHVDASAEDLEAFVAALVAVSD
jgi:pyridoxal 5-phosphate dependent beta-lyase